MITLNKRIYNFCRKLDKTTTAPLTGFQLDTQEQRLLYTDNFILLEYHYTDNDIITNNEFTSFKFSDIDGNYIVHNSTTEIRSIASFDTVLNTLDEEQGALNLWEEPLHISHELVKQIFMAVEQLWSKSQRPSFRFITGGRKRAPIQLIWTSENEQVRAVLMPMYK